MVVRADIVRRWLLSLAIVRVMCVVALMHGRQTVGRRNGRQFIVATHDDEEQQRHGRHRQQDNHDDAVGLLQIEKLLQFHRFVIAVLVESGALRVDSPGDEAECLKPCGWSSSLFPLQK